MKYKLMLQLFADDNNDQNNNGDDNQNKESDNQEQSQEEEKKFTQSELDEKINKRLARQEKKKKKEFKESDEYKAFVDYQESKKTDDQKIQDQLNKMADIEKQNSDYKAQLENYKNRDILRSKNVKEEFVDYINFEVSKLVNEENDFNTALEKYLEDNDQYLNSETTDNKTLTTGKRHKKGADTRGSIASQILAQQGIKR